MNIVLRDNRKYKAMTAAEADALLEEIVKMSIEDTRQAAIYDKKLAAIKSEFEDKVNPLRTLMKQQAAELEAYINANPERFAKPRARKTPFGSYGLRSVSSLEITDEAAVIAIVKAKALPLYTEVIKLDKKAVEKAICDGHSIPGAEIQSGERAFYKANKELIDAAKA